MTPFARSDNSLLAQWWWEVDRWLLVAIVALMSVGILLGFAASPAVAKRINLDSYHFVTRQVMFIMASGVLMVGLSMLRPEQIRKYAVPAFLVALGAVAATHVFGMEIKGARRWLAFGSFGLQPSEFLKPMLAVVTAAILSREMETPTFPGKKIAVGLIGVSVALVITQPDLGQSILLTAIWCGQMFLAGLPIFWILVLAALAVGGLVMAYLFLPHVTARIDAFLEPGTGDTFQADTAVAAFKAGGVFGRGPGEGSVKAILPDAHTDYIFAVAGEEFGAIACLLVITGFAVIIIRSLIKLYDEEDSFLMLAIFGLVAQFGLQSAFNIAVNLALVPPKGMTLPFVSYGGSSMLAMAVTMGLVLALTRRNQYLKSKPTVDADTWRYAR